MEISDKEILELGSDTATVQPKQTVKPALQPVKSKAKRKKILFLLLALLVIGILIAILLLIKNMKVDDDETITKEDQTRPISEFAQKEEFIKFENDLFELRDLVENLDLSSSELAFPILDLDVDFESR